jgi:YjbE family integral membrane protein
VDFLFNDFQKLFSIIVVDLVLSGDNAVVIGMAARTLPPDDRRRAIVWGGVGAVGLRIVFTVMAALLLDVPLIQAIGGVLLIWIAIRLVTPETQVGVAAIASADTFAAAVRTIVLADVVMSLDNILAVGGASEGNLMLLIFGLALSIPILLFGSNLVAQILHKYPWLLLIGVLVLVHSAITMIVHDHWIEDLTHFIMPQWEILLATAMVTGIVLAWVRMRHGSIAGLGDDGAIHSPSSSPEAA